MTYAAVLQAREIGKKDMDTVREAIRLSEERAKIAAAKEAASARDNDNKR
jgi:hypothetical protein